MTAPAPLRQPIPLARSILWSPAGDGATGASGPNIPFPVFVSQAAFNAILEHVATPQRGGQGILGFLLGDQCECPETGIAYLVVEVALRLNQPIYGDRTRDVVTRLWDHINNQLQEQRASLIGWYHSHPPLPLALSGYDLETHEHYFAEPWQVALLLGADPAQPAGAFFRAGSDEGWFETPLPFYELLSPESIRPDGKKRSCVTWTNYRASDPGVSKAPLPPAPLPPPPVPEDSEEVEEAEHDSGELKFLTAAEDMPPPHRSAASSAAAAPPPVPPPHAMPSPPRRHTPPPPAAPPPPPVPEPAAESEQAPAWPDEFAEPAGVAEVPAEPEPAPARVRRRRSRRRWRGLVRALVLVALVGGGAAAYWYFQPQLTVPVAALTGAWSTIRKKGAALVSSVAALKSKLKKPAPAAKPPVKPAARPPAQPAPQAPPAAAPSPYARLDRSGDSVALLVRSFAEQRDQFSRGQLPCAGLARARIAVENSWNAYNTVRRGIRIVDPAHAAREQALYAGVDSVERRFDRSGCARS